MIFLNTLIVCFSVFFSEFHSSSYNKCDDKGNCLTVNESSQISISDGLLEVSNQTFQHQYKVLSTSDMDNYTLLELVDASGSRWFAKKMNDEMSFHFLNSEAKSTFVFYQ